MPVEAPLYIPTWRIDKALQQGVKNINWKSHGIDYFLTECMGSAKNLDGMLSVMKQCLSRIEEHLVFGDRNHYINVDINQYLVKSSSAKTRHESKICHYWRWW